MQKNYNPIILILCDCGNKTIVDKSDAKASTLNLPEKVKCAWKVRYEKAGVQEEPRLRDAADPVYYKDVQCEKCRKWWKV